LTKFFKRLIKMKKEREILNIVKNQKKKMST